MDPVKSLFEQYTGQQIRTFEELPSSGSNRRYFRITGDDVTLALREKNNISLGTSKLIGAACWVVYILVIGSAVAIIYTEVAKLIKKK